MKKITSLSDQLKRDEGWSPYAYTDSEGYITVGYGFMIDKRKNGRIPKEIADYWLDFEISTVRKELLLLLDWFKHLDEVRQDVLVNMAYNMGTANLLKFKKTLSFVKVGLYMEASIEMLNSKWATQVKDRAIRLSKQMKIGEYM